MLTLMNYTPISFLKLFSSLVSCYNPVSILP
ncbi:hypothetical protein NC651_013900 [Populus alba x Populus x berolinensis]|nr:hypothetical protein NC651_013900 [Populus alba x Populus x berolinensis]